MIFRLLLLSALLLSACQNETSEAQAPRTIRFALENTYGNSEPEMVTDKISAYVFQEGVFYKSFLDLAPIASGERSLTLPMGCVVYFLSATAEIPELTALKEGASLADFLNITYSPNDKHTATQAPGFTSGWFEITPQLNTKVVHRIPLSRAVARYDVDATHDSKITIHRVVLHDASASTRLFAADAPIASADKCTYEVVYDIGMGGVINDIFRSYESSDPVNITVYGRYDNIPFVVRMTQPKVERNKIYKIVVKNVGASITGIFEVLPWGDGGVIEALPDASEKITINIPNSTIPADVLIDADKNEVKIPYSGTTSTFAFLSDSPIEIAAIEGLISDVQITSLGDPISTAEGVMTKYRVEVAPQGNGRLSYSVVLNMKHKLQINVYDQIRIVVEQSPVQIETATLGGVTWMAFNARSQDLNDQVYPLDGSSVEQMYDKNWISIIGGLYQWGRKHMYIPWVSGQNNAGNQAADIPWLTTTFVPCPEGYRVPTHAEIRALFPNNLAIPGTYDYNGESVEVTIKTGSEPIKTPTGVSGTPRYLQFESKSTGNKLYIPMAGHKGDKSGSNNPSFGAGVFLWSNTNAGAIGGWAYGAKFWPGSAASGTVEANAQLQAEGYAYLRCVKK